MVTKLLGGPLTFGDETQIAFIQQEEEKVKKYEKLSSDDLKDKYKQLDLEKGEINLEIHYHEEEIRDLENKKEEKRNVEGFIIIERGKISKYVRHKNGSETEHLV